MQVYRLEKNRMGQLEFTQYDNERIMDTVHTQENPDLLSHLQLFSCLTMQQKLSFATV